MGSEVITEGGSRENVGRIDNNTARRVRKTEKNEGSKRRENYEFR